MVSEFAPSLSSLTRTLRDCVEARFEPEQVPFFRSLVEQPSCSRNRDDVEAALARLDTRLSGLGFVTIRHPAEEYADHRVYERHDRPALALVGHMDTVFPRSMGFFGFERDGDTVRGPGVLDMKSGLSAIVAALEALRQVDVERYEALAVRVLCVSDEEVGSPTSRDMFKAVAESTTEALVLESGRVGDRIVMQRKGCAFYEIKASGRSAHAGNDHVSGVNAIWALSVLIPTLQAMTDYERGTTVNVGLIHGGTAKNTVPDQAGCTVDVRFESPEDGTRIQREIQELVERPSEVSGAVLELIDKGTRPPMTASAASQALRARYEHWAQFAGLGIGEAPLQGGGSDANLLSALGVPVLDGLGPFGKHFHRVHEWSSLASLKKRTVALACFLAAESDRQGAQSPVVRD